ncbi:SPW repeat domain-containing protein [Natrarchaeobius oligotrophus]|uniref:SPW repeat-containing integral membrane domain-containing protein n=1 Tax=Natrarchaeobius chitinivorans TaxID=1679083 RepID=A0A3N6MUD0_NATCH|nr:hypothetical protein [Natrarchaeobius chitinivorans]RQG98456.1 hypothetical protein EA472_17725 [Natrarchaeobius chitinivorans]
MSDRSTRERSSPVPERAAGLAAGLGALILLSGVFFTGTGYVVVVNLVLGAGIATAAAYAAAEPAGGPLPGVVAPAIVILLGLVTVAVPFVLEVTREPLFWSNVVVGALVVILAGTSVVYGNRRGTATVTSETSP